MVLLDELDLAVDELPEEQRWLQHGARGKVDGLIWASWHCQRPQT
jgi:hypothetical protein